MKTSRIFIGDIYIGSKIFKKNAILIYYPGRGYLDFERLISSSFVNLRIFLGKFDKVFMGTTIDLYQKYVNRDTLKNFDYENLNLLKSISSSELRLVIDHFNNKKSNLF